MIEDDRVNKNIQQRAGIPRLVTMDVDGFEVTDRGIELRASQPSTWREANTWMRIACNGDVAALNAICREGFKLRVTLEVVDG